MHDVQAGHKDVSAANRRVNGKAGRDSNRPKSSTGASPAHSQDVTRIYLSEIGKARLLTAEEEISLTRAAREGCMPGSGPVAQILQFIGNVQYILFRPSKGFVIVANL